MSMTETQKKVFRMVAKALYETVLAVEPHGAPSGVCYAAFQQYGCTLAQYQAIEQSLIIAGVLTKENNVLRADPTMAQAAGLA